MFWFTKTICTSEHTLFLSNTDCKSSINLENDVTPTIQGRDFVIATLAAPTVMKEPEKPAEAEAAEGEAGAEAAAEGDKPAAEGEKKEGDDKKAAEENK